MTRIRVATFNIRNGLGLDGWNSWPFRRTTTARTIAALAADVIALQEVYAFQQRSLQRRLADHQVVAAGRTDGVKGERCPILVRRNIEIGSDRTTWFGDTPEVPGTRLPDAGFPRIATTATLVVADQHGGSPHRVDVTSTHLDEASAERRIASAAQLASSLDRSVPQIVMGDFNADPGSAVLDQLCAVGLRTVEPAGDAGTEHRFTGRTDGRRIDHILVSDHLRIVDAEVYTARLGRTLPSDHWPVTAVLELVHDGRR